ncbi:MAG: putative restriction endonuclease [Halomonadaceae bacterium T82-2]|nr:MAG: putative restriction endonuclease [Halomonadaceae bacterium T82-2]
MDSRLECLSRLKVDHSTGSPAPHQPCLLLAIICEIQAGHITSPRIPIDTRLIARYHDIFETVTEERHRARPWMPMWALKNREGPSGKLWHPEYAPSIQGIADQMGQPKSLSQLNERFTSARLDSELFNALQNADLAGQACALLTHRYLATDDHARKRLEEYLETTLASGDYQRHPERLASDVKEADSRYARSAAFRDLVLEAYDYRCAASRLRYITPDYRYLVEAAHLIPFSVSQDDRPSNGIALTPNLHWAMDNHLIAPGPDGCWHVSPTVDTLVSDNQWLCDLNGKPLVLPRTSRWHPDTEALTWRLDHLRR